MSVYADLPDDLADELRRIDEAFAKDRERSGHFESGRLFRIPRGDGYAVYEVINVTARTARVICRYDLSLDRWEDPTLGQAGVFPRASIERQVDAQDRLNDLFARRR